MKWKGYRCKRALVGLQLKASLQLKAVFLRKAVLSLMAVLPLMAVFLLTSGCADSQKSMMKDLVKTRKQLDALIGIANQLSENQAQMREAWLPKAQEPAEIQISKVAVEHHQKPFEEVLMVQIRLISHLPEFYSTAKHYAIFNYIIEIPEKEWKKTGQWVGLLNHGQSTDIELQVVLPEFGVAEEQVSIEFEGLGVAPLVPLVVSRVAASRAEEPK